MSIVCVAFTFARRKSSSDKHDVLVLLVLVALDDVRPLDFLVGLLAVALVADGREVALVEHRELERLAVLRRIELDRNVDEA